MNARSAQSFVLQQAIHFFGEQEMNMKMPSYPIVAGGALVCVAALALILPGASAQIQAGPSYVPIGAAASGSSSTAWFHHPSSGRVVACQVVSNATAQAASNIQCVVSKLP